VNINDAAARQVTGYWGPLVQQGLVSTDADFTDQWFRGLAGGKYAAWLTAAWGPIFLQGSAKGTSGKWRAAPLPQWNPGQHASGNWGGSSNAVVRGAKYPAAAAALAQFLNSDPAPTSMFATQQFLFPTTTSLLADSKFLGTPLPFYGGQKVNQVFSNISETVQTNFTWSPFQDYTFNTYNDTLGKAMTGRQDLSAALTQWQNNVAGYAKKQGFTVTTGG
jgi:multiple sugar transport system substrate-binding protein